VFQPLTQSCGIFLQLGHPGPQPHIFSLEEREQTDRRAACPSEIQPQQTRFQVGCIQHGYLVHSTSSLSFCYATPGQRVCALEIQPSQQLSLQPGLPFIQTPQKIARLYDGKRTLTRKWRGIPARQIVPMPSARGGGTAIVTTLLIGLRLLAPHFPPRSVTRDGNRRGDSRTKLLAARAYSYQPPLPVPTDGKLLV
jgi:hypothetical protein